MLYFSLSLIFLGILIFLYSFALDAKKRREESSLRLAGAAVGNTTEFAPAGKRKVKPVRNTGVFGKKEAMARTDSGQTERGNVDERSARDGQAAPPRQAVTSPAEQKAVLYEDSSHVIDYGNESGRIDTSLDGYRSIRRIGSGRITVEKGGINFYTGKKIYRFDFHRISDIKSGSGYLALFTEGSETVKLFIFESGVGAVDSISGAYRQYLSNSA
ncbi:MAG: hypothetical protein A2176_07865 [Spirochaetes bacterium RBG_13_51_14]|nr:MAG: hypothetical protein A2176_07865 [Spirochaetes bacterium RBG_13_51_14]